MLPKQRWVDLCSRRKRRERRRQRVTQPVPSEEYSAVEYAAARVQRCGEHRHRSAALVRAPPQGYRAMDSAA